MATTPQNRQKLLFLHICAPQTFCAHFLHFSNDSHLNLPHTRSSSLGVFAIAMATIFQSCHSYAVSQNIGTLFTCFTCLTVKFVEHFAKIKQNINYVFVLDMKNVDVSSFQQNIFFVCTRFLRKKHVIALHFGWTCCFQDNDFFNTTSVHDGVIEVHMFAIK